MYNGTDPITDGITTGVEERKQRGLQIAALARIEQKGKVYYVPSVTSPRPTKYEVAMLHSGTTKTKFGDSLKSKTEVAGRNEVLCKTLCHNICCLIHAFYELGIQAEFPALTS